MAKVRPAGIDLGTTYSAMAWVDENQKSQLIANAEGDLLTPSVVLFEDDAIVVGKEAKKVTVMHADRVATCVKRDMGKPVYSQPIRGQYLPPEVIQSYILRKLKNDISKELGPDFRAVITVPAFFDEPRRRATYDAGEMAGLKVLDILNEPTAAALAFGQDLGYLTKFGAPREPINVIVYDLGGGTFDVTLIDMKAGDLRTICTDGDVQLGGHDFDMRLVDLMAEAFQKAHNEDPRSTPQGLQRLLADAEEAKHTLSARQNASVKIHYNGKNLEVKITRDEFEERTADLLERTRYTTRNLLTTAGMEWKDINRILLTGGSTRMPMVIRMLKELSGLEPDHSINPDEAVARGAAIYSGYLLASKGETGHKPTFDVTNVNAHSLGIEGIDPATMRRRNTILIPRNSRLPAKKTEQCMTKEVGQQTVVIQVLEGESLEPQNCTPIGRTVIRDLPPNLPQGWPVDVIFEYGVNGRLTVTAKVSGTDREVRLELERDESMSKDRVDSWKRTVAKGGGMDAFDLAIQQELETLKGHAPGGGADGLAGALPAVRPVSVPAQGGAPAAPVAAAPAQPVNPGQGTPSGIGTATNVAFTTAPGTAPVGMPVAQPMPSGIGGPGAPVAAGMARPAGPAGPGAQMAQPMPGGPVGTATATAPQPGAPQAVARPGQPAAKPADEKKKPIKASSPVSVLAQVFVAVVGLVMVYYIMVWIAPSTNFLRLNLPGLTPIDEEMSEETEPTADASRPIFEHAATAGLSISPPLKLAASEFANHPS